MQVPKLILVAVLVIASFFIGRSTVKTIVERDYVPPQTTKRPEKLSAITPTKAEEKKAPNAPARPPKKETPSARDSSNAALVTEALADAAGKIDDLGELIGSVMKWVAEDPDSAIAWLATGDRRDEALRLMFAVWGSQDPDAASTWLDANPDFPGHESISLGLALGLAESGESEKALEIAASITDPVAKAQIWSSAAAELYSINQDELRQRLEDSDLPAEIHHGLVENWEKEIAQKAMRNAQNLASVYSAAVAAGAEFKGGTAAEIVAEIRAGVLGANSFSETKFQIPNLSEAEVEYVLEYLDFSNTGNISYKPSQPENQ